MKTSLIYLQIVFSLIQLSAQDIIPINYTFQYGSNPNMESGVRSSYALSNLIFDQTNLLIKKTQPKSVLLRALNVGIIQLFLGKELYGFAPHEYFGHVKRLEEFNLPQDGFELRFPDVGGFTKFKLSYSVAPEKRLLVSAAGPEVSSLMAYQAVKDLYSGNYVATHLGNNIFFNKLGNYVYYKSDFPAFFNNPQRYVDAIKSSPHYQTNPEPGDFGMYAFTLTESYGYYDSFIKRDAVALDFPENAALLNNVFIKDQNRRMNNSMLLSLADLTILQFLIGNYQYIVKGKTFYKPFMIDIKGTKLMPSIRSNLGEIGAENYFDLSLVLPNKNSLNIYYRNGGNLIHDIKGFGVSFNRLNKDNIKLHTESDYWFNERKNAHNFNLSCGLQVKLTQQTQLVGTVGYKTEGNLMGKPFNKGVYVFGGLGISLDYFK
jgi:hypothetical protein